jgi:asparagine N-glycosylation enzyme membrane subunit Stt3
MKIDKPSAEIILAVLAVIVIAVLIALLLPSWPGTLTAVVLGLLLGSFLRRKGIVK